MRTPGSHGSSRKVAGAVALGVAGAGAALWALQHRSVSRAVVTHDELSSAGLLVPEEVSHRFVEADDGARLHVMEAGRGPAVVLVHGFMLDSSIWAAQFRDLAAGHRVVALDLRGHGRSGTGSGFADPGVSGIVRLAADLRRVLEELEVREALLVGHSMGGMVALQLAQEAPAFFEETVTALVLASTAAGPFVHFRGLGPVTRVGAPASARAVLILDQLGVRVAPSRDLRYWISRMGFGAEASPAQVRFVEALHLSTPSATVAALLPSLASFDLSAGLESIEKPVLVTVGSHDRLTPPRLARRMASALPRAQLVELARCGHMPMIERPHEFSHMLEEFCAKTGLV